MSGKNVSGKTTEPMASSQETEPFFQMLRRIWAERERTGIPPRTREEVDAEVRKIRDEFDEQVEESGQLQEECQRMRLAAEAKKAS